MSEGGGPKMLRMVRWQSVLQDADRLRNWREQDLVDTLSRTVHMGDSRSGREGLLDWLKVEKRLLKADPSATPQDFVLLKAVYRELRSKVFGRAAVMDTELGYHSQNVGPDRDRAVYDYSQWANRTTMHAILGEGREVIMTGHMGTGKSHLAVSLMEHLFELVHRPTVHVATNIPGIQDKTGKFSDRIYHVTALSEVLRIWAKLPPGHLIALVVDEPETNLRGGSTKSVRLFGDFRYMLRKLGMSKVEIWHSQGEVYKALREEDSEHVTRIHKVEKETMDVVRIVRGEPFKQHVTNIHDLRFLHYAHRGMASIDIDVDMQKVIRSLNKLEEVPEMKRMVQRVLVDAAYYLPEFRPESDDSGASHEAVILAVLRDVGKFLTQKRHVSAERLREEFGLRYREAREVAREATKRWRDATPDWESFRIDGAEDEA